MTIPEIGSPAAVAQGLGLFAFLAILGTLVGLGALSSVGVIAEPWRRWMLAPFIATVVWTLPADLLVRLGLTMAQITPWVAVASLGLAIAGVVSLIRAPWRDSLGAVALLGACWVIALGLMWPIVERGLTATLGSGNLDTAYYSSLASAYWRYGITEVPRHELFFERFFDLNLRLGLARNHSTVLLALFSPLVQAGEPLFVRNLFAIWSLFTLGTTMGFYGWSWSRRSGPAGREGGPPRLARAAAFSVAGACIGWAAVPTLVGNWDNGLYVSVGPALAGLVAHPPPAGVAYPFVLGTIAAYGLYTYPELTPVLGLLVLPLMAAHLRDGSIRAATLKRYGIATLVGAAIASVGVPSMVRYMVKQVSQAWPEEGIRSGGSFAQGLVLVRQDAASWWSMGSEHAAGPSWSMASALSAVLMLVFVAGCVHLVKRRALGEVTAVIVMVVVAAYFSLIDLYGYATYKVLNVGWWLAVLCLVEGLQSVSAWRLRVMTSGGRARALAANGVALVVLVVSLAVSVPHKWIYSPAWIADRQPSPASLIALRDAASRQPPRDVLVSGALSDLFVMPWIFYALIDSPLRPFYDTALTDLKLPGGARWTHEDAMPDATLLAAGEAQSGDYHLRLPAFDLLDSRSLVVLGGIDNPNGTEAWGTWLGTEPIVITLHSTAGQRAELRFEAEPGPSLPESPARTLELTADGSSPESERIEGKTAVTFAFTTTGQSQVLKLSTADRPSVSVMPNGDRRPLMVAIRKIQVELANRAAAR